MRLNLGSVSEIFRIWTKLDEKLDSVNPWYYCVFGYFLKFWKKNKKIFRWVRKNFFLKFQVFIDQPLKTAPNQYL